jgi:hypothetical protein
MTEGAFRNSAALNSATGRWTATRDAASFRFYFHRPHGGQHER